MLYRDFVTSDTPMTAKRIIARGMTLCGWAASDAKAGRWADDNSGLLVEPDMPLIAEIGNQDAVMSWENA